MHCYSEVPGAELEGMLRAAYLDFLCDPKFLASSSAGGSAGGMGASTGGWGTETARHRNNRNPGSGSSAGAGGGSYARGSAFSQMGTGLSSVSGAATGAGARRTGASGAVVGAAAGGEYTYTMSKQSAAAAAGPVGTPTRDRRVNGVRGEGGKALDFEM